MKDKDNLYDDTEIHKIMSDFTKEMDNLIDEIVDEIYNGNERED